MPVAQPRDETWTILLRLGEGREDSGTLAGTLDGPLSDFVLGLQRAMTWCRWNDTLAIVASDTSLRYRSFARSLAGLKEMAGPLLYIGGGTEEESRALECHADLLSTAFDLRATI